MPKYLVEMHDGRKFQVEADSQPTEDEVMAHLGGSPAPKPGEGPAMTRSVLGHPLSASEGEPSTLDNLNDAMAQFAHPQTRDDMTRMLLPNNIGPLATRAAAIATRPLAAGARVAANALESVPAIKNVLPFANPAKQLIPFGKMAGRLRTVAQAAQDADMGVTRGADMYSMRTVPRSTDSLALKLPIGHGEPATLTAAESVASPAASALSDVERAQLAKQGYSPELINKIAEQAGGASKGAIRTVGRIEPVPSHAPAMSGKSAKFADIPNDPAMADIVDRMAGGADMPTPGNGTMPSEMQQPRVDIGAERVGRANGLSKEAVRAQTDPILGEARGEASPILPQKALNNIIDAMKALPREGGAREAYVQAATSGKAQWQIENIRRTLEHLGLLIPAAATVAPSVRDMLLQRMRSGVTGASPTPSQ